MSGSAVWIALALLLPLATAGALWGWVRRRRRVAALLGDRALLATLLGEDLSRVPWRRVLPVVLAAAALGIALADPRWGAAEEGVETRGGTVVLVLDASGSMLAADLAPNRMDRMRAAAREIARGATGAAVGVVVFAGRAYALVPPTVDRAALELYLDALEPAMVTQSGSSLSAAVRQGIGLLAAGDDDLESGSLVLITDGDALEDRAEAVEAAAIAARAGVPVHVLAAGTAEGAPVPEVDYATGRTAGFKREPSGAVIVSRLQEGLLRRIAASTGGEYRSLAEGAPLDPVVERLRERAGRASGTSSRAPARYGWFAAIALVLLAAEAGSVRLGSRRGDVRGAAVLLLLVLASCGRGTPDAPGGDEVAALEARLEREPGDEVLRYNLGTRLLRLDRFEEARSHLQAASRSGTPSSRQPAYYNLGNSDLEPAFAGLAAGVDREAVVRAIVAYKRALVLDPGDGDAKYNLELARRLLATAPPPPLPQGGGGGGGGGGGDDPRSGEREPRPSPSGGAGPQPPLSPGEAERLLAAAQQREVGVQRDVLRKPQPRSSRAH